MHLQAVEPAASSTTRKTVQQKIQLQKLISEKRTKEITDDIVESIPLDMRPMNITEAEGFLKLMEKMEPGYTVPPWSSVSNAFTLKYSQLQEQISTAAENATALAIRGVPYRTV